MARNSIGICLNNHKTKRTHITLHLNAATWKKKLNVKSVEWTSHAKPKKKLKFTPVSKTPEYVEGNMAHLHLTGPGTPPARRQMLDSTTTGTLTVTLTNNQTVTTSPVTYTQDPSGS
jgi:hypothetical protein